MDHTQIEAALKRLMGMPLWRSFRAADMQVFQFGARCIVTNRRGEKVEVGEHALHVQCTWRLSSPEGIVVGSRDLYYPAGAGPEDPAEFDWDTGPNRRDERVRAWMAARAAAPPVVEAVAADAVGGAVISLSGGFRLELFPDDSLPGEHWRMLGPGKARHFVVTGVGAESE